MSFPRYPKYKASGVEWLRDVPEHWQIVNSRRLFNQAKEASRTDDVQLSASQKYGVVPQNHFMELEGHKVALALSGLGNFKHVEMNDFVISLRSFQGGIERSKYSGCVSPAYTVLRPAEPVDANYWGFLLKSRQYVEILQTMNDGLRDGKSISYQQFGQIRLPYFPLPEQTTIADFLDRETAKIDELVAEQRRLMALLKEKRQAVISHAVTKGLNPNAPMKPSGIEWLGEVPEEWEVQPLRNIFNFSKGLTITKANLQDEGVYCVNYGEIHSKYGFQLNPEIHPLRCVAPEYLKTNADALVCDGDFVFADTSEDLEGSGNFTRVSSDQPLFAGYHTIIARPQKDVSSLFLAYEMHSSEFRSQVQRQVKGVKVFSITQRILKSVKGWLPPHEEQAAIVDFLDSELAKFDTLTTEAQRAIDLLQERRTAIISAAVTGQIDVRQQPRN